MFTKYAVIQKIGDNSNVIVYTAEKEHMNWTFEHRRGPNPEENENIFPFVIRNSPFISIREAGAETKCVKLNETICFSDDYSIPEGFVICILPPTNYLPYVVKFKGKTEMPVCRDKVPYNNPGYVQIYSNSKIRQSAITLITTSNCFFGFTAIFKPCSENFPSNYSIGASDTFEASIKMISGEPEYLTQQDIAKYCGSLEDNTAQELLKSLNKLVELMKDNYRDSGKFQTLKENIGRYIFDIACISSSTISIADSMANQGFAYELLHTVYAYFNLRGV